MSANQLLAALPQRESSRLQGQLQPAELAAKQILYEVDAPVRHVYFPTSGIVTRLITTEDGSSVEVGLTGREGVTGLCTFAGCAASPFRETVLVPGEALRIETAGLLQEVQRAGVLSYLMRQYLYASFCMASHFAACNQLHNVQQRCCRLLLMLLDRVAGDDFPVTHENLALLLGVRRASVSEVARQLQNDQLIRYRWGRLAVLNRKGIESIACRCYQNIQASFVDYGGKNLK